MTAPEDYRDTDRFQETLDAEEGPGAEDPSAEQDPGAGDYEPETDGVPDAEPDEDLAAGPPEGR